MTSRIQAKITHNHPVTVTKESAHHPPEMFLKSDGEPGSYHGEKTLEIDMWFSGDQQVIVRETAKE